MVTNFFTVMNPKILVIRPACREYFKDDVIATKTIVSSIEKNPRVAFF